MKSQFSTHWISSSQPRKQRKYVYNAPLHTRHNFLSVQLSKSLRTKYGKRNIPVRKGDEVLVMRGSFKKKKAKVLSTSLNKCTVVLEGMQRTKKDGTKVNVPFSPSVLQIQTLNTDDKMRLPSQKKEVSPASPEDKKKDIEEKPKTAKKQEKK